MAEAENKVGASTLRADSEPARPAISVWPAAKRLWPPAQGCSALEFAALLYLTLPLVLFFSLFTKLWIAAPAQLAILAVLYRVRPRTTAAQAPVRRLCWRHWLTCAVLAGLFLWVCGYMRPFGHTFDWLKHFAVINELGQYTWPPTNDEAGTFLRYSLGYYLVPGLLTAVLGNRLIELFVLLQTWTGLVLLLALLLQKIRPARPTVFLVLFLLFSGPDLVGWLIHGGNASLLVHKEWWAGSNYAFAYDGHATLFIWVPQHALAGMLGTALLLLNGKQPAPPQAIGLLGAAVLFWSPFAALGLMPFALAAAVRGGPSALLDGGNILCATVLGIPLIGYLTAGAADVPHGFSWNHPGFSMITYVEFLILEVGLYLLALRLCGWEHLRHPAIVIAMLLVLPLYRIGAFNDFTMRACIPALMLVGIAGAAAMTEVRSLRCIPLAVLMLAGSITSVLEIIGRSRDGTVPARSQTLRSGVLAQPPYVMQYNAPLPNWVLRDRSR